MNHSFSASCDPFFEDLLLVMRIYCWERDAWRPQSLDRDDDDDDGDDGKDRLVKLMEWHLFLQQVLFPVLNDDDHDDDDGVVADHRVQDRSSRHQGVDTVATVDTVVVVASSASDAAFAVFEDHRSQGRTWWWDKDAGSTATGLSSWYEEWWWWRSFQFRQLVTCWRSSFRDRKQA